ISITIIIIIIIIVQGARAECISDATIRKTKTRTIQRRTTVTTVTTVATVTTETTRELRHVVLSLSQSLSSSPSSPSLSSFVVVCRWWKGRHKSFATTSYGPCPCVQHKILEKYQ